MKMKKILLSFALFSPMHYINTADTLMSANESYLDMGRDCSSLRDLVAEISLLDENKNSILCQLHTHIEAGNTIACKDIVLEALAYAENIVEKKSAQLSLDTLDRIHDALDVLAYGIENENLDVSKISHFENACCENSCCKIECRRGPRGRRGHRGHSGNTGATGATGSASLTDLVIPNLTVINFSAMDAIITNLIVLSCIDSLCIGDLTVTDLTAGSADINCDITVGCNISMNDSISANVGNIIKNGVSFIHTYPAASLNTFVGQGAGNFSTTGTQNAAFGASALMNNTTGAGNTSTGALSLLSNTIGQHNTAAGNGALLSNTTGSFNTAIGYLSMFLNTTGRLNVAIGDTSMTNNITGSQNVVVGVSSFTSGDSNVIVGYNAGNNGSQNVGMGMSNLLNCNSNQNVAIGFGSMAGSSSVNGNNTAIGYLALQNSQGAFNVAIGSNAGQNSTLTTSNNNIYIGNNGANESGAIRIGTLGTHISCFIQGINGVTVPGAVPIIIDAAGQLGTVLSTRRVKHDIQSMDADSAVIYQLNPVTFVYNNDPSETKQYGLIAEEVQTVFPEIVVRDAEGQPYTVQYQVLPVLLLNEVQKQRVAIEQQKVDFSQALEIINDRLAVLEKHPRSLSNMADVLAEIHSWNEDTDSLHRDLPNWYTCEIKEAILQIITYAEDIIIAKDGQLSPEQSAVINNLLNSMPCV